MTNPASATRIELEIGADSDGRLTGLQVAPGLRLGRVLRVDRREHRRRSSSPGRTAGHAWDVKAYGVETNRFGTGSYRGPGGPQASFALEIAHRRASPRSSRSTRSSCGIATPCVPGDLMVDGEPWVRIGTQEVPRGASRSTRSGRAATSLPEGEGVGLSVGVWPGGKEPAAAICRLEPRRHRHDHHRRRRHERRRVRLRHDRRRGVRHRPAARSTSSPSDTSSAPRSPMSGGSVVTYSSGRAIQRAVEDDEGRSSCGSRARSWRSTRPTSSSRDGRVAAEGRPGEGHVDHRPRREARRLRGHDGADRGSRHAACRRASRPSVSAHLAHVRVDPETGEAKVLEFVIAQDVGARAQPGPRRGPDARRRRRRASAGRCYEAMPFDDQAQLLAGLVHGLRRPGRRSRCPPIETIIVEVPAPDGPFGAKGIGEAPVCGSPGGGRERRRGGERRSGCARCR